MSDNNSRVIKRNKHDQTCNGGAHQNVINMFVLIRVLETLLNVLLKQLNLNLCKLHKNLHQFGS